MFSLFSGLCIIISNEKFFQIPGDRDSKRMEDRKGTEVDNGKICTLLHENFSVG